LIEGFEHARFCGALSNTEDLSDFEEFEPFVVAQHDHFPIVGRQLEQRLPHLISQLALLELDIRPRFIDRPAERPRLILLERIQRELPSRLLLRNSS